MPPVVLPLTVQAGDRQVDLVLQAAAPTSWAEAAPGVLAAAGLPPDTPLYLGAGRVDPALLVGAPPLLAGTVLSTSPGNEQPVDGALVLDCIAGPDAGGSVPLLRDSLLVGRSPRADLVLADPDVSARHAEVAVRSSGVTITDLLSTNGVRLLTTTGAEPPCPAGTPQPLSIGAPRHPRRQHPAARPAGRYPDAAPTGRCRAGTTVVAGPVAHHLPPALSGRPWATAGA